MQLLQILARWTELLENGGQIDVVYTDLEKAFDKIPDKRLISILFSYGIKKNIGWTEAFLHNRKQRVHVKESLSNWALVWSGNPQGSLLGPILFIMYINDLVEHCHCGSDLYLYAGDAKLFSFIKSREDSLVLQKD